MIWWQHAKRFGCVFKYALCNLSFVKRKKLKNGSSRTTSEAPVRWSTDTTLDHYDAVHMERKPILFHFNIYIRVVQFEVLSKIRVCKISRILTNLKNAVR